MAELKEARVPDIGGYDDVPVIELLVAVGDTVKPDQGLVTLESDKATMEVPSPFGGVVRELKVKVGDKLSEGGVVALIEAADAGATPTKADAKAEPQQAAPPRAEPVAAPEARAAETGTEVEPVQVAAQPDRIAQQSIAQQQSGAPAGPATLDSRPGVDPVAAPPRSPPIAFNADELLPGKVPFASPAVRLFARELGVDLAQVQGTERGGRISKEDVQKFVKAALSGGVAAGAAPAGAGGGLHLLPWPKVDFAKFGEVETRELTRIQKISGANLARNWAMIPHVTQHDDADITELEALRVQLNKENEKAGIKLTMLAFIMKASVAALQKYPTFNASLDASGENLTLKKYFHIGFAADTPNGLVVPVVRDVDRKGVLQIAQASIEKQAMGAAAVRFEADAVLPDKVPYASPAVRLFARELGVDLAHVAGSERGGRISREDVQKFVKSALAGGGAAGGGGPALGGLALLPWPKVDFAKFGAIETKPLSRIQKLSGANLARNWAMIPHVTQHDDADITELEALRVSLNEENAKAIAKGVGAKLTMLAFLMKASVAALQKFPTFNASLDASGENLVLKQYFHIGFAADTPNGLVVPVLRDVDRKGVIEIAKESGDLAAKAREGKLGPADMQGGCFTISSLGGIGGTSFTPIVNAPEVAILGVSKSAMRPVWDGHAFQPRLLLPLSLSYDHRVVDGAAAARFTAYLAQLLGDLRRALL
jgi:pyruvate dehydrogenase E2 component (dihydrolipoamide acetyltransferase)